MKWINYLLVLLIIPLYGSEITSSTPVSVPTNLSVFYSSIEAQFGETIVFNVAVRDGDNNYINQGNIQIVDDTNLRELTVPITAAYTTCNWIVLTSDTSGWHSFTIHAPVNAPAYQESTYQVQILINTTWINSTGYLLSFTEIGGLQDSTVLRNESLVAQTKLSSMVYTYFRRKAYITLEHLNSGFIINQIIYSESNSPIIAKIDYNNLSFPIPDFISPGFNSFRLLYSGSSRLNHRYAYYDFNLTIEDTSYRMEAEVPEQIERGNPPDGHSEQVIIAIYGYNPNVGTVSVTLTDSAAYSWTLYSGIGQNLQYIPLSIASNCPVGWYQISGVFTVNNIELANFTKNFHVYDETQISVNVSNDSPVRGTDSVTISGYVITEDVLTEPVSTTIDIYFQESYLISIISDIHGYFAYTLSIAENCTLGFAEIKCESHSTANYCNSSETLSLYIKGQTMLQISPSLEVSRNSILTIEVAAISGTELAAGNVALEYNNTCLTTVTLQNNIQTINYYIADSFPSGPAQFTLHFTSIDYDEAWTSFQSIIYAIPQISSTLTTINVTAATHLSLTGFQLYDETNAGINGEVVELWDSSQQLASTYTTSTGYFTFNFTLPPNYNTFCGYCLWFVQFTGNTGHYLRSATTIQIDVIVSPSMTMEFSAMNNSGIIGEHITIDVTGTIFATTRLDWYSKTAAQWLEISTLKLNSNGTARYEWIIPAATGIIQIRFQDLDNEASVIRELTVYRTAVISLALPSTPVYAKVPLSFNVSSDSRFRVYINNIAFIPWTDPGTYQFVLTPQSVGLIRITVEAQDSYLIPFTNAYYISVVETTKILIVAPSIVNEEEEVVFNIEVMASSGIANVPLIIKDGVSNSTLMEIVTDNNGYANFSLYFYNGMHIIQVYFAGTQFYLSSSADVTINVRAIATIVTPQNDFTFSLAADAMIPFLLSTTGNIPLANKSLAVSLSIDNIYWSSLANITTDDTGNAVFVWQVLTPPGFYWIKSEYSGDMNVVGAIKIVNLWIKPGNEPTITDIKSTINYSEDSAILSTKVVVTSKLPLVKVISSFSSVVETVNIPMTYNELIFAWEAQTTLKIGNYNWQVTVEDSFGRIFIFSCGAIDILPIKLPPQVDTTTSTTSLETEAAANARIASYGIITSLVVGLSLGSSVIKRKFFSEVKK